MAFEHVVADPFGCVVLEQVDRHIADTLGAELLGETAQALLAAGNQHQLGAGLAGEAACGRLSDAAGGAGDEHHPGCCRRWVGHERGRLAFQKSSSPRAHTRSP